MNKRKIKMTIVYSIVAAIAGLLAASMFAGCNVYEHEEIEIRRCPQIQDTVAMPGWELTLKKIR